jgi:hypothetical protein
VLARVCPPLQKDRIGPSIQEHGTLNKQERHGTHDEQNQFDCSPIVVDADKEIEFSIAHFTDGCGCVPFFVILGYARLMLIRKTLDTGVRAMYYMPYLYTIRGTLNKKKL